MNSITDSIIVLVKLYITFKLVLFMTRVIMKIFGVNSVFSKTRTILKFILNKFILLIRFIYRMFKGITEQHS